MSAQSVVWCLLLFVAGSRQLSITEFAVPSAIEAGTNAELQCRFSEGEPVEYIKWWWTPLYVPTDDRNRVLIYQRVTGQKGELPYKKRNFENRENDTIVLLDMKSVDSGVYECEVSGISEVRKHENLIVFSNGTDLQLNATKVEDGPDDDEDEDVLVQCEAHDVTPEPELSIFINGDEIVNLTQYVTGGPGGMYDAYVNITVSSDDAEGAEFRCELFFQNKNISHPPYVHTLTYTQGAGQATTETPEDTTHSEVASELQNTNGVTDLHASLWVLFTVVVIQMSVFS